MRGTDWGELVRPGFRGEGLATALAAPGRVCAVIGGLGVAVRTASPATSAAAPGRVPRIQVRRAALLLCRLGRTRRIRTPAVPGSIRPASTIAVGVACPGLTGRRTPRDQGTSARKGDTASHLPQKGATGNFRFTCHLSPLLRSSAHPGRPGY